MKACYFLSKTILRHVSTYQGLACKIMQRLLVCLLIDSDRICPLGIPGPLSGKYNKKVGLRCETLHEVMQLMTKMITAYPTYIT